MVNNETGLKSFKKISTDIKKCDGIAILFDEYNVPSSISSDNVLEVYNKVASLTVERDRYKEELEAVHKELKSDLESSSMWLENHDNISDILKKIEEVLEGK